jgi:aldose 1-epimerase
MPSGHEIRERRVGDWSGIELVSRAADLTATFVPDAGMVGCSLTHRGDELLGQRGGLQHYVSDRGTMGIPFLHPFANRVTDEHFEVDGRTVDLGKAADRLHRDPNGLPIHGLLAGADGWIAESTATEDAARLTARFDFAAHDDLVAAFPFPHAIEMEIALASATLGVATTVTATGDAAVPISFGYHPYLRLPDVAREDWAIEAPVSEHLTLDERSIPTGERVPATIEPGPLGDRTYDDVYAGVEPGTTFSLQGGGRRIQVRFTSGYPVAVVYAPSSDDVICFEPVTAPTNALLDRPPELHFVAPGDSYRAAFELTGEG